jgi:hypothetical protein
VRGSDLRQVLTADYTGIDFCKKTEGASGFSKTNFQSYNSNILRNFYTAETCLGPEGGDKVPLDHSVRNGNADVPKIGWDQFYLHELKPAFMNDVSVYLKNSENTVLGYIPKPGSTTQPVVHLKNIDES